MVRSQDSSTVVFLSQYVLLIASYPEITEIIRLYPTIDYCFDESLLSTNALIAALICAGSEGQADTIRCNSGLILGVFAESVPDLGHPLTGPER